MIQDVFHINVFISVILFSCLLIQLNETLRCYSCQGECTKSFFNSIQKKIVYGNNLYDACSITKNSNGLISRNMTSSSTCRSSFYQFCCNHDFCNSLLSIPLRALTNFSCAIDTCPPNSNQCNHSIIYLSSAAESCLARCSPKKLVEKTSSCCNSPECNRDSLPLNISIHCYTCDFRIDGLESRTILNTSSPHVYRSATSSRSQSCAMMIGLPGKDLITGDEYSAFVLRRFIDHCMNYSLGNITYGGARVQGRIDCCSTSLCNKIPLEVNLTVSQKTKLEHSTHHIRRIVFILVVCLGVVFMLIGMSVLIYRFRYYKYHHQDNLHAVSDGANVAFIRSR